MRVVIPWSFLSVCRYGNCNAYTGNKDLMYLREQSCLRRKAPNSRICERTKGQVKFNDFYREMELLNLSHDFEICS